MMLPFRDEPSKISVLLIVCPTHSTLLTINPTRIFSYCILRISLNFLLLLRSRILLYAIDDYYSSFDNNVASIRTKHKTSYYSTINIKEIAKAKIMTIINKIIDDSSEFHLSLGPEEIVKNMAKELLIMIDEKKEEKNCDFERLYKVVEFRLEEIAKINSYDYISLCAPKQIVHEKNDMLKAIYFR